MFEVLEHATTTLPCRRWLNELFDVRESRSGIQGATLVQPITTMLTADHAVERFSCGVRSLDRYLIRHALANQIGHLGATYVLTRQREGDVNEVFGYYTLAMSHVSCAALPRGASTADLPRYPVPTVLLARLAVHRDDQGKLHGERLLLDAMWRARSAATHVAAMAMEVEAINSTAQRFYTKYGFMRYLDDPNHLFLPMSSIVAEFSSMPAKTG